MNGTYSMRLIVKLYPKLESRRDIVRFLSNEKETNEKERQGISGARRDV